MNYADQPNSQVRMRTTKGIVQIITNSSRVQSQKIEDAVVCVDYSFVRVFEWINVRLRRGVSCQLDHIIHL